MAISDSCFCIIARFTCRGGREKPTDEEIFDYCVWRCMHSPKMHYEIIISALLLAEGTSDTAGVTQQQHGMFFFSFKSTKTTNTYRNQISNMSLSFSPLQVICCVFKTCSVNINIKETELFYLLKMICNIIYMYSNINNNNSRNTYIHDLCVNHNQ